MPPVGLRVIVVWSLAALLTVGACHEGDYYLIGGRRFSVEAARGIKIGMTATRVRSVLGPPTQVAPLPGDTQKWVYRMDLEKRSWVDLGVRVNVSRARMTVMNVVLLRRGVVLSSNLTFDGPK